ncbi:MAG: ATP-dependent DNA helicase RecQ [Bacteroides sp.]|nr:ATP-dependent DNA helicase RecQ [Bacteroides sp.]
MNLQSILFKYWGFSSFRPLQEEVIQSVLDGHDTLALMPTGGGKSLCYQVPTLARAGLCIVVTPLIALMKDQVQNLKNRGIKAIAVHHGMSRMEIDIAIDNCVYGDIKFLYLSPERLTTELLRVRIPKMKVSLLAVDEAHCISQWGYDFRPPYLRIAEVRELLPNTPILALTATATPEVVKDIQVKLDFRNPKVFRKSFERKNLAYLVLEEEDKLNRLLRICKKVIGTGIVYARNRKKTREIAQFLSRNGVPADFFHAGQTTPERDKKQKAWMAEKTSVMVATNAFGMGIDKANVRFVVHMDLPDCPEAYFQEAGRAGRDEKKAYAVLLFNKSDSIELKRHHDQSFPPIEFIKKVYNALGNYFQLAIGAGREQRMAFSMSDFAENFAFDPVLTYNALLFLEREGYLALSEALSNPSKLFFTIDKEELYRFQLSTPAYDSLIKVLLRSYAGLFTEFVKINENDLAKRLNISREEVVKRLKWLQQVNILQYEPQNDLPTLTFLEERLHENQLRISPEVYHERRKFARERLDAMLRYAETTNKCRSILLLNYFGEDIRQRCGQCDVCLERNKADVSNYEFDLILKEIKPLLLQNPMPIKELLALIPPSLSEEKVIRVVQWLMENDKIILLKDELTMKWAD